MRLPVEQRAAVVAVDMQGYSVAETARLLGVAEGTVKSRCSRARAKLAEALGYFDARRRARRPRRAAVSQLLTRCGAATPAHRRGAGPRAPSPTSAPTPPRPRDVPAAVTARIGAASARRSRTPAAHAVTARARARPGRLRRRRR